MTEPPIKILIVDDDQHMLMNLQAFFEDADFEVWTSSHAESALIELGAQKFDIGIVDMRLPGMDGNAFILSAHSIQPDMHFIIHTGSSDYRLPKELLDIGVAPSQVFMKPVANMSSFVKKIYTLTTV